MKKRNFLFVFVTFIALSMTTFGQKLKVEEVIAKHLSSIGSDAARSKVTDVSIVGDAVFSIARSATRPMAGRSVLASEGSKSLFAMTFPAVNYPLEKIAWNGKDLSVGFPSGGSRSVLGDYLHRHDSLIKNNLIGGALNNGWILKDTSKGVRLSLDGSKNIDGRDAYAVTFEFTKGSGVKIKLYFDKETFRHVRSEYSRVIPAQIVGARPDLSSQQSEGYENLVEEYSDFKTDNDLTLPRKYRMKLYVQPASSSTVVLASNALREYVYELSLKDFYYNQKLDAGTFVGSVR